MKKKYCVHVFERPYQYENVIAENARKAEDIMINTEWARDYENIQNVEVMHQCDCGYDNDTSNKNCEECGEKL
ncbi:MAG: hypothetical protein GTO02_02335 [Candidatus Dadabacteria bacterium]|nr:hypothetical protein [Candidatus Dadabacteria bacterium]